MNRVTWRENHFKKLFYDLNHVQIKSYVDAKKDKEQDYLMFVYESKLIKFQIMRDLYQQYKVEFPNVNVLAIRLRPDPFICACEMGRLNDIKLFMHYHMYMYDWPQTGKYMSKTKLLQFSEHASSTYVNMLDDCTWLDVEDSDDYKISPIGIAAINCHVDVLKYLVEFVKDTFFKGGNYSVFFGVLNTIAPDNQQILAPGFLSNKLNTLKVLLSNKRCSELINVRETARLINVAGQGKFTPIDVINDYITTVQDATANYNLDQVQRANKLLLIAKYQEIVELFRGKNGKTSKELFSTLYPLFYSIKQQEYDDFLSIFNEKPAIFLDDEGQNVFHYIAKYGNFNTANMIEHIRSHEAITFEILFSALVASDYNNVKPINCGNIYVHEFIQYTKLKMQHNLNRENARLKLEATFDLLRYAVKFSDEALFSDLLGSDEQLMYKYFNGSANNNLTRRTILHNSCIYRVKNSIIELLLNSISDEFVRNIINMLDVAGKTALDYMLMSESTINSINLRLGSNLFYPRKLHNKTSIIKLLESKGAKQGKDLPLPLHNAIEKQSGVKKILDRHNVGIDDTDKIGRNALHWCAWHGRNVKMFELLLLHRSYTQKALNRKDKQGHTPLDYAILFNRSKMKNEIVAFIQKNFGKRGEELKFL